MRKTANWALGLGLLGSIGCAGQGATQGTEEPIGTLQQADFVNGDFEAGTRFTGPEPLVRT